MAETQETSPKTPFQTGDRFSEIETPLPEPDILDFDVSASINSEETCTPPPLKQPSNLDSENSATISSAAIGTPPSLKQPINLASINCTGINSGKSCTPDRLKVPKAFKYPERYTSPTDLMMSPVTKGLLARTRKTAVLLPPSRTPPKIQSFQIKEMSVSQS